MPGGDRTGPYGAGPMTGRGLGYCAGFNAPGYTRGVGRGAGRGYGGYGRGRGFGRGYGYGHGAGYGWRAPTVVPVPVVPAESTEAERNRLDYLAKQLESELEGIKKRLEELKKKENE
ncbi:MAG: DUF5320 domain-containing protein [Methermicoccaceae archaeon]